MSSLLDAMLDVISRQTVKHPTRGVCPICRHEIEAKAHDMLPSQALDSRLRLAGMLLDRAVEAEEKAILSSEKDWTYHYRKALQDWRSSLLKEKWG